MKKSTGHLNLYTTPELEFKPLKVYKELGFPNLKDDFLRLLSTKPPTYEVVDDMDDRVSMISDEIEFQITRLTETNREEVVLSVTELAKTLVSKIDYRLGQPLSRRMRRDFTIAEDVEYKRKDDTLPSGVDPVQVLKQVLFLSPLKAYFSKNENFKLLLYSPLHASLLTEIFWWIFLEIFQKHREETPFLQTRLSINIARRLKDIQQRMEHHQRGVFFKHYSDTLGKCVFVSFLEAFPYQAQLFGNRFKQLVMQNINRWTGIPIPAPRVLRKWDLWPLVSHSILPILISVLRPPIDVPKVFYDSIAFEADVSRLRKEDRKYSTDTSGAASKLGTKSSIIRTSLKFT